MCLISRFSENFVSKRFLEFSVESEGANNCERGIRLPIVPICHVPPRSKGCRTVSVSVVRKASKFFTDHPTLPVVWNIHKVPQTFPSFCIHWPTVLKASLAVFTHQLWERRGSKSSGGEWDRWTAICNLNAFKRKSRISLPIASSKVLPRSGVSFFCTRCRVNIGHASHTAQVV